MKVSVVVPAFNEEKLLAASLVAIRASMEAFREQGWESELIVCDNNSTDRTAEIARAAGAVVVFEPINQIARARNKGAEGATGDWLVFVDADSHPSRELLKDVIIAIESGKFVYGGCKVLFDEAPGAWAIGVKLWNFISRTKTWAAGSFIFCETAAFRKIGGFSADLYASEELDLSQRLKKHGRQIGKRGIILQDHPLVTSARKLRLYSTGEHFRMLLRMALNGGRSLRSRDHCTIWYDGRR